MKETKLTVKPLFSEGTTTTFPSKKKARGAADKAQRIFERTGKFEGQKIYGIQIIIH